MVEFKNELNRVCLIIPGFDAGGIENYVLRYLEHVGDVSHITIMARSAKGDDLLKEYQRTGVTIRRQGVSYFNVYKWFLLYRFFKKSRFRVVCDFNENFSGIPMLVARLASVGNRIAFYRRSSHGFKPTRFNLMYASLLNKLVFSHATAILSNSKHAFDFFFSTRYITDKRFRVIPNGVESQKFNPTESREEARTILKIPAGKFVLGHSGRFDPAKNHVTFFRVAASLSKKYPDILFLFCGKGTDSPRFTELLEENQIREKAICLGTRKDVQLVLRTMDLFYFPSVTEGQPNALIEAVLSGLPVVTSDIKPIREALPESSYKDLINPTDVEEAFIAIEAFYLGRKKFDTEKLKDWAKAKYDVSRNLSLFTNELIR